MSNTTPEAALLQSHAIELGDNLYELPSASFIAATQITKQRLPEETFPPD